MNWLVDYYNYYDPGKQDFNKALGRLIGVPSQKQKALNQNQNFEEKAVGGPIVQQNLKPVPTGFFPNIEKEWQEGLKTVAAVAGISFIGYSIVKRAAALTFTTTVFACAYAVARNPEYRTNDVRQNLVRLFDDTSQKITVTVGPFLQNINLQACLIDLSGRIRQLCKG